MGSTDTARLMSPTLRRLMALLPPIPDRPADRPETWTEYLSRRAIVAMHRQFADELGSWLKRQPAFDPFRYFIDMAGNRVPFRATRGQTLPIAYGTKRVPSNVVFIDEDVTWRNDAALFPANAADLVRSRWAWL